MELHGRSSFINQELVRKVKHSIKKNTALHIQYACLCTHINVYTMYMHVYKSTHYNPTGRAWGITVSCQATISHMIPKLDIDVPPRRMVPTDYLGMAPDYRGCISFRIGVCIVERLMRGSDDIRRQYSTTFFENELFRKRGSYPKTSRERDNNT